MSTPFRKVTDDFWVAPQISVADVAAAAANGVKLIINNRPDGEAPGQPSGAEIAAAAEKAGVAYVAVPIRGRPGADQVEAVQAALVQNPGPALAYCAGGLRAIVAWGLGQAISGERTPQEIVERGRAAGFDLSSLFLG